MGREFDLVVRNATLVSSSGRRVADLGMAGGRFTAIEAPGRLGGRALDELDATGLFVLPGLVDGHVHFRQPGLEQAEDWTTGSRAAVMGGITTVLDMPNTVPPTATAADAQTKAELAAAGSYCDYGLFGLLGAGNLRELPELVRAPHIVGLKAFLGPTTGGLDAPDDDGLRVGLQLAREAGLRVAFHAEDAGVIGRAESAVRSSGRTDARAHADSRPVEAEVAAIDHAGRLLAETGADGHIVHVTSAEGVAAVDAWRKRGVDVTCEVTAHHCFLSADDYERLGGLAKCNPPLRDRAHGEALLRALAEGRVDCIASDHAPHAPADKRGADIWQIAAGMSGVETTLRLFLTYGVASGGLTLEGLVAAFAEAPARVWGLWPRKGSIALGSDADLTVVDVEREGVIRAAELHAKHNLTPFDGRPVRGAVVATVVRGRLVARDGRLISERGWGRPAR